MDISDRAEADIIFQTKGNFKIAKEIYKNMYKTVGHKLQDYLQNLLILKQEIVDENLRLNEYKFRDFNNMCNQSEMINTFDSFY